ncbi:MAG: 6-phosphogluconolactonase [Gammaproteobacteria bacterium]
MNTEEHRFDDELEEHRFDDELEEHRFDDPSALVEALVLSATETLGQAISERGVASLVVSGGSTPKPFFEALRRAPLDWPRVSVTLADERWVAPDLPESNEALVRSTLLQGDAAQARFLGHKNGAASAVEGAPECARRLGAWPRPFDLVVLGMGDDGHTASLFPDAPELPLALSATAPLCLATTPASAAQARISLSLAALLQTRRIVVHIVGDRKWRVLQAARETGRVEDMPVRAVLGQGVVPVQVYWAP